eukprot:m.352395 g.352395  ORF g.352395 m.352395 type:complete len:335 (+) comp16512_c0_seq1:175-1179(+)
MGAFLEKPITDKHSESGQDHGLTFALSSMQGWRTHMEDAHTMCTSVPNCPGTSFFAVFDGHGGKTVSLASAPTIVDVVSKTQQFKNGDTKDPEVLKEALYQGMFDLDEKIKSEHEELRAGHDRSGSTAISCFITPTHIVVANVGDSRLVVGNKSGVRFETQDHKPTNPEETTRIKSAGGFVEMSRVCGNLAVSRALGDFEYKDRPDLPAKDQKITCAADMTVLERQPATDTFVILACDGIWDVISSEQAVKFVEFCLTHGYTVEQTCEKMLEYCLDRGSKDNMSAIIVCTEQAPKQQEGLSPIGKAATEEEQEELIRAEFGEISEYLGLMADSM